ncbi:chromosome segregation protein SMC [Candidatus Magnetomorum sp. HK-1]|nr:chromosome segregation protein SMC [Candidatus Magnetomorum sp. HK-1]
MITRLQINNFRSLKHINLPLNSLNVLCGLNGSGKSNIVDSIRFLKDALRYGLKESITKRGGIRDILCKTGHENEIQFRFEFSKSEMTGFYSFSIEKQEVRYHLKRESLSIQTNKNAKEDQSIRFDSTEKTLTETHKGTIKPIIYPDNIINNHDLALPALRTISTELSDIFQLLTNFSFYNIIPANLRAPQILTEPYPLDEQGNNLYSTLKDLQEKTDNTALLNLLKAAIHNFNNYSIETIGEYLITRIHYLPDRSFELSQESEGTLKLLGLLTAMNQHVNKPSSLFIVEEPELNIYPETTCIIGEAIKELSLYSQVIITSHSPDLINTFHIDDLKVVQKNRAETIVGNIIKRQREAIDEKLFSAGEIMRMEGFTIDEEAL